MKFRALASAAIMGLLLATTACGTGNLANNAYGVNRAYDGNVRHGVTANRNAGNTMGNTNHTGNRGNTGGTGHRSANTLENSNTGSSVRMTGNTSNATTGTHNSMRRLGNAAHNAGSGLGNNGGTGIGRRANQTGVSGAMRARGRYNRDGGYQMSHANGHNARGGMGYNGRVDSTSDITNLHQTRGAYSNPNNFDNAVYRHQGQGQGQNYGQGRGLGLGLERSQTNAMPANDGVRNAGSGNGTSNGTHNYGGRTMVNADNLGTVRNEGNAQANGLGRGMSLGNGTARNLANNSYLTNDVNLMDGLNAGNGVVRNTNRTVQTARQNVSNNANARRRNTATNVRNTTVRNNAATTRNVQQTQTTVAR